MGRAGVTRPQASGLSLGIFSEIGSDFGVKSHHEFLRKITPRFLFSRKNVILFAYGKQEETQ